MSGSGEVLLRSGDQIAGRFQLSSRVARRGSTQVWRATDVQSQREVAVKILTPPEELHGEGARAVATGKARFLRESELLLALDDPGIVKHLASGEIHDGALYLVTQWLEGKDLHDRLREGPVPVPQAIRTVRHIAKALAIVHQAGLVHRDVKPRNIRLDPDLDHPRLIDFGLARAVRSSDDLTLPGTFLGTPRYVAPEQARGHSDVDARADVFSLGCVLYECLTGQRAFDAKDVPGVLLKIVLEDPQPVEELCPAAPLELLALLGEMLSKDRAARPASGLDVVTRLTEVQRDQTVETTAVVPTPPVAVGRSDRPYEFVVLTAPVPGGLPADSLRVVELLSAFSGRLTNLADGSLAATMSGGGVASDRAAVSAHVALALRDRLGDVAIAVGAGHGSPGGTSAAGEAIEHVTALLRSGLGASPTVALDDTVARLLPTRFTVQAERGAHALLGMRDVAPARTLLGKPTRCVGREHELTALSELFVRAVVESAPRVALVTGPAGFGKSRLRYELLRRLWRHGQPALVLFGRGEPLGGASPFSLIGSALRRSFGFIRDEHAEASRQRVRERVAAALPADRVSETTEFIGRLAGLPFSDESVPPYSTALADALVMGDHLRRALREFMEAECRQRPCVLVLEDLHWGDRASLRLVRHVGESMRSGALFVLAIGRPEVEEQVGALLSREPDLHVQLGPLSRDAALELAFDVLGDHASPDEVGRIVSRAAGNAHFLEELLRDAAEGSTEELPGTITAMILSRVDGLEPAARQVLRAASLFGMRIPAFGLSAVVASDVGIAELTRIVTDLCAQELLSAGGDTMATGDGWYMFRQALLREVVYQSLTEEDRHAGHRMVGQWLSENAMAPALVVAEHFRRANELTRAAACFGRAAVDALEGNDFEAAIQHAKVGLECSSDSLQRGVLLLRQAEGHQWLGAGRSAQTLALQALEMLPRGEAAWCQALSVSAMAATRLAEKEIAMDHLREISDVLSEGTPSSEQLIAAARLASNVGLLVGRAPVQSLVERLEAITARAPIVSPTLEARMSILRARDAALRGDVEEAIGGWRRAAAFFEQGGDIRNECNCQINTGFRLAQLGAYDEAEDLLRRAHVTAERLGLSMIVPATKNNLGFVLGRLGRLSEAAGLLRDAIRLAAVQQDRRMEGSSRIYLSEILRLQGDVGGAVREARAALEAVSNVPASRALNLAVLADCLMASERPAQAMAPASEAAELLDSLGSVVEGDVFIRRVHAEVLDLNDRQPQAKAALAAALRVLRDREARIFGQLERERFRDGVPENRRVFLLARLWGMET